MSYKKMAGNDSVMKDDAMMKKEETMMGSKKMEAMMDKTHAVIGTNFHPAEGTVRVVPSLEGNTLRYENFKTINGPDLYVYLAKDLEAKEFVSLGQIKGTEGNINYAVPADVTIGEYTYALTWCKQFNTLFNYADLTK